MQVLLYSQNPRDAVFFKMAADYAHLSIGIGATGDQICQALASGVPTMIIVDVPSHQHYQAFEKLIADKVGLYSEAVNANSFIFVADQELHENGFLDASELVGSFIPRVYKEDAQHADHKLVGRLMAHISKEKSVGSPKGVARFLESAAKPQSLKITRASQKKAVVEALRDYLLKAGFKSRPASTVATAVDELVMNAVFDAPVDPAGKFIYTQTPRNTEIELSGRHAVELEVAFDGHVVAVAVRDQFGSLDKKKLLGHLCKSYREEEFKVKTNVAGAGLGLANVLRNCGGLIFECDVGVMTQVTVFYQKTDSFKEFKDQFRFLSTLMYFS
jgi:hypothetical protein